MPEFESVCFSSTQCIFSKKKPRAVGLTWKHFFLLLQTLVKSLDMSFSLTTCWKNKSNIFTTTESVFAMLSHLQLITNQKNHHAQYWLALKYLLWLARLWKGIDHEKKSPESWTKIQQSHFEEVHHLTWQMNSIKIYRKRDIFLEEYCFMGFIVKSMVPGKETDTTNNSVRGQN